MSVTRAAASGVTSGAAAALGVLFVCLISIQLNPEFSGHSEAASGFVILVSLVLSIWPALLLGSIMGGIFLAPYAYAKSRFALKWVPDLLVLVTYSALWSSVQDVAGSLAPSGTNFFLVLLGASVGLIPLHWLKDAGASNASPSNLEILR